MRQFFAYDGPVFNFLSTVVDLALLNLLLLVFSLPIFTAGAAVVAGHYTALKLKRGEGTVVKSFWKSFKLNFKQATFIELIVVMLAVLMLIIIFRVDGGDMTSGSLVHIFVLIFSVYIMFTLVWVLPLQARFINPVYKTFRWAFHLTAKNVFRTFYMLVLYLLPISLVFLNVKFISVVLVFGLSGPIYGCVLLYNKVFEKLEEQEENTDRSDEE